MQNDTRLTTKRPASTPKTAVRISTEHVAASTVEQKVARSKNTITLPLKTMFDNPINETTTIF